MKKCVLISCLFLIACGDSGQKEVSSSVDVCRCLSEPGNTDWSKDNRDACRDEISAKIGVENWEKVNMSENPEVSGRFDDLGKSCGY